MVMLQHKLNLKVSQKQVLTPGLVQMVNVLALNKMELLEMINNEIVENPVLEELDENVPILDDAERNEEPVAAMPETAEGEKTSDPFDEIDFGSYFQDYLDPGFRTPNSFEISERPSFENFLSRGTTLMDHLQWQLGAMSLAPELCKVTEMILGNLDADGYLTASEDELREALKEDPAFKGHDLNALLAEAMTIVLALDPPGTGARDLRECLLAQIAAARRLMEIAEAGQTAVVIDSIAAEAGVEEEIDAAGDEAPAVEAKAGEQQAGEQRRERRKGGRTKDGPVPAFRRRAADCGAAFSVAAEAGLSRPGAGDAAAGGGDE